MVFKCSSTCYLNSQRYALEFRSLTIAFLARQPLPSPSSIFSKAEELLNPIRQTSHPEEWKHWTCEICADIERKPYVVVGGELEWNIHLRSRKHRTKEKRLKRKEAWDNWKASQELTDSDDGLNASQ